MVETMGNDCLYGNKSLRADFYKSVNSGGHFYACKSFLTGVGVSNDDANTECQI